MASPRAAAAVVLVRHSPELEVFWVRRAPKMIFQGGFHAFPGGQLEANEDPPAGAVRELEEETGVRIAAEALRDIGRWVTPAFAPRRFDTWFFLAPMPAGQTAQVTTPELDSGEWIRPADAVARWKRGEVLMAPPVLHAMRMLAAGLEDIEARARAIPEANGAPVHEIEMRAGIILVPVKTPTLPPATHTNCYVVGDREVVIVDPASPYPEEQAVLDAILEKIVASGRRLREVWLTHLHRDHVSGANHLRDRWGLSIAAHPITRRDLEGSVHVDRVFEEEERLELPGDPPMRLEIHHTPGHARGHVCIFERTHGSLITGDLMAGVGTIVIDPPEGDMAVYMDSLRRMQALPVTALFPSHGPVMANAKTKIQEYLDHRAWREELIFEAWQKGLRETRAIVSEAYADVSPMMHALAERSTVAHLQKLKAEGRI